MTLVRLTGNHIFPVERMTPGGSGCWEGVQFTTEPVENPDFLVSLNYPSKELVVNCPREHCWALIQEPPSFYHHWLHTSHRGFSRLYSCDHNLRGSHRVLDVPYLAWYLDRTYDQLKECPPPEKAATLSTVTSALAWMPGHKRRLEFLRDLQTIVEFEWYGRGVKDLPDKWDGLAPYRYSLAFENYYSDYYWTEKLIDCFLTWTVPIYCGCPRVGKFFPAGSFVQVDLHDPKEAEQIILETIHGDHYEKNFEALCEARTMVLDRYNPMAFLSQQVRHHLQQGCHCRSAPQTIAGRVFPESLGGKLAFALKSKLEQILRRPIGP